MYIKTSKPIIKINYGFAVEDSLMIEDAQTQACVRTQTRSRACTCTHAHTHTHTHTHTESHFSFTFKSTVNLFNVSHFSVV